MATKPTTKPTTKEGSISRAGFDDSVGAKRNHTAFVALPSHITAKHVDNHDHSSLYSLAVELPELAGHKAFGKGDDADKFCFSRADVLARVESFKRNGQEQRIRVGRTRTGKAVVTAGFLRHAAALFLEVTGELASCPGMADGLRFDGEVIAATPEQQVAAVFHSSAENERKSTSPIDDAWKFKRLLALGVSRADIAAQIPCSLSTVNKRLALLSLPVSAQLAVHEGRLTWIKALADASSEGVGSAHGPRLGHTRKAIRRNHTSARPLPEVSLSAAEVVQLLAASHGVVLRIELPPALAELFDWYSHEEPDAPAEPKPAKQPRKERTPKAPKLAPPKPGEVRRVAEAPEANEDEGDDCVANDDAQAEGDE